MKETLRRIKSRITGFRFSMRHMLATLGVLIAATLISMVISDMLIQNSNVSIVYTLAVLVVACITPGYFYGYIAALLSVFGVNYFFTAPYWAFNFSLTGYPITFLTLLIVSTLSSTLMTRYREQVTRAKLLMEERNRVALEIESERLRSNLLRAISHDLRTPLTCISGAISVLLESEMSLPDDAKRQLYRDIDENSQWLIRIVENLLSSTRITNASSPIKKTSEMAEEIIAEAASQLRRRFPDIQLTACVPDQPLLVPMDATLIEQVLINLIENAVYHSHGEAPIELALVANANKAEFSVRDHGVGIDEDNMLKYFNGCGVIKRDRSDSKRGMGIGLSVCASIIKAHGGILLAKNAPDGGAVFSFWLPL